MKWFAIILLLSLPVFAFCDDGSARIELSKMAIKNGWEQVDTKPDVLAPTKHLDTALMHFNHAILLDMKSGPAWFASAYTYSLKGNADEALRLYRKSLEYQPEYVSTHMNIGLILLNKGDMDNSLKSLKKALELDPEQGVAHGNLARWYYRNRRYKEARQALVLARKYKSTIAPAYLKLLSEYIDAIPEK